MMKSFARIPMLVLLGILASCAPCATEEIVFHSGPFKVVGDLRLPEGTGPHPVVVFVHGDGANDRTVGGAYLPIMERMLRAGYATFAWDKPGTGESTGTIDRRRPVAQRAQIVRDGIAVLKDRPDVDSERIGLWGISQAGWVMPLVVDRGEDGAFSEDVAFMIAVSCAGGPGVDQGVYLVTAQAICAGLPEEEVQRFENHVAGTYRAQTYDEYVRHKSALLAYPAFQSLAEFGFNPGVAPEEDWYPDDLDGEYYFNPMPIIERTTIPVLAFFGEKDTQVDPFQGAEAYRQALERAGNPHSRLELIPGVDHDILVSETGCLAERKRRSEAGWRNFAPAYLDTIEEWLRELRQTTDAG